MAIKELSIEFTVFIDDGYVIETLAGENEIGVIIEEQTTKAEYDEMVEYVQDYITRLKEYGINPKVQIVAISCYGATNAFKDILEVQDHYLKGII